eukprot:TRINITY_DN686_c0_g2_i1.p1 TRINITY_DN686_c0_g2~~TRINITY_DN686_c0_g2_i1.p1  ORF type:complete len:1182 (+),score=191.16 TRINITY_DN686_c0_g2_i1:60-3605(+)
MLVISIITTLTLSTHFQTWCSAEYTGKFGFPCVPLPCNTEVLPGNPCLWDVKVGDVVKNVGLNLNGRRGTVVCTGTAPFVLVLYDHYTGGGTGDDANMYCNVPCCAIGGACSYPNPIAPKGGSQWTDCSELIPQYTPPPGPIITPPPTPVPTGTATERPIEIVWADKAAYPPVWNHPDSLITSSTSRVEYKQFQLMPEICVDVVLAGTNTVTPSPEMYCVLSAENATITAPNGGVAATSDRGTACFDEVSFVNTQYLEIADKVSLSVTCDFNGVQSGVGWNITSDTVTNTNVFVQFPNTATLTEELPTPIPPPYIPQTYTPNPYRAPLDGITDLCDNNNVFCPFDCQLSEWSSWSTCNQTCGSWGASTRFRTVIEASRYGGKTCASYEHQQFSPCNRFPCESLCPNTIEGDGATSGSPGEWTCGFYSAIKFPQLYSNGSTSLTVLAGCAALQPGITTNLVFQYDNRNISVDVSDEIQIDMSAGSMGSSCNLINGLPCVQISVHISKYGDGPWDYCGTYDHTDHLGIEYQGGAHASVSCQSSFKSDIFFVKLSPEVITSPGTAGSGAVVGGQGIPASWGQPGFDARPDGIPYGGSFGSGQFSAVFVTRLTVHLPCVYDCEMSEWGPWSQCTNECGGGRQYRERLIIRDPVNGGYQCNTTAEEVSCNIHHCPSDCVFSDWSSWSECSISCGGGSRRRYRDILQHNQGSGSPCPAELVETEPCNLHSCGADCSVTSWSNWGPCSVVCEGGLRRRQRSVISENRGDGEPCPHLTETEVCNDIPCATTPALQLAPVETPTPTSGITPGELNSAPRASPFSPPYFGDSPLYDLPLYNLGFVREAYSYESDLGRHYEVLGEPLAAFTVRLADLSLEFFKADIAPNTDGSATVVLTCVQTGCELVGDTQVPLTEAGTAAFGNVAVSVVNNNQQNAPIDLSAEVVLTRPVDYQYRSTALVRQLSVRTPTSGEVFGSRVAYTVYRSPLDSFSTDQFVGDVSKALGIPIDQIDVLMVEDFDFPNGASSRVIVSLQDNAVCTALAVGMTGVAFRLTAANADELLVKWLEESLDPTSTVGSSQVPPNCNIVTTYAAPESDPRMEPYVNSTFTLSPPPTAVPTPVPESDDGYNLTLLLAVLLPLVVLIWALAALAVYCARRRHNKKEKGEQIPDSRSSSEIEVEVQSNPIEREFS